MNYRISLQRPLSVSIALVCLCTVCFIPGCAGIRYHGISHNEGPDRTLAGYRNYVSRYPEHAKYTPAAHKAIDSIETMLLAGATKEGKDAVSEYVRRYPDAGNWMWAFRRALGSDVDIAAAKTLYSVLAGITPGNQKDPGTIDSATTLLKRAILEKILNESDTLYPALYIDLYPDDTASVIASRILDQRVCEHVIRDDKVESYREYIRRFPHGTCRSHAEWSKKFLTLAAHGNTDELLSFIHRSPDSTVRVRAERHLDSLRYIHAAASHDDQAYRHYLFLEPTGRYRWYAMARLAQSYLDTTTQTIEPGTGHPYFALYDDTLYGVAASEVLAVKRFSHVTKEPTIRAVDRFLKAFPNSFLTDSARVMLDSLVHAKVLATSEIPARCGQPEELYHWQPSPHYAACLDSNNWIPGTVEEVVFYWIASRDEARILVNWDIVAQCLLPILHRSRDRNKIETAVYALVGLGIHHLIPEIARAMETNGGKEMAEAFLNSGNQQLREAAENWATRNNFRIGTGRHGNAPAQWGRFR